MQLAACGSKSNKYKESAINACRSHKVENQFIVHWYDAQPSLVIAPDIKSFIDQHESKINYIEPNYYLRIQGQFKSVRLERALSAYKVLNEIGALSAWRKGYLGQNKVVAVIDSGIDIKHPKLRKNIFKNPIDSTENNFDEDQNGLIDDVTGWNFSLNRNKIIDEIGHGTSIAGIITGQDMSGESLGIAPQAKILPLDIMSGSIGNEYDAKLAVDYSVDMKVNIINNSWTITCSDFLSSTFKQYENENIIFINSAGNVPIDIFQNRVMLASLDLANFLNVGSTNLYGRLSSFSGFGKTINIWAPGEQVPVLSVENGIQAATKASGTSVSAAIMSGAAAVIWSAHPNESALQIVSRIIDRANLIQGKNFISIDHSL